MRRPGDFEGRRRRIHRPQTKTGMGMAIGIFLVLVLLGGGCYAYARERTTVATVIDKDRVCESGGGDCKYLVYTDKTTFRITDYIGRVTSSDAYGRIQICHQYRIKYYGFRSGLGSVYPNIKSADDLGPVETCQRHR